MRTAAKAPFHALRSAMVALTVLSLAAGAHTLAGGQLPAAGILLALLALTGLASTTATRLKLGLPAMAGLLGAGQLVLHQAFAAFSGPAAAGSVSGPAAGPGGSQAGPAAGVIPHHLGTVSFPAGDGSQLAAAGPDSWPALLMLAGHALATLLCAMLLARGEDALWLLAAWLRPLLRLPAAITPGAVAFPAVAGWPAESAPLPRRNLRRDCRRGPPAAVVFA